MRWGRVLQFIGMTMLPSALIVGITQENAIRQELMLFALGSAIFLAGLAMDRRK